MAYAKIENTIVTDIIMADADFVANLEGDWIECDETLVGIGDIHCEGRGFYGAKPFPSWKLDKETLKWVCPKVCPDTATKLHNWDEASRSWVLWYDAEAQLRKE